MKRTPQPTQRLVFTDAAIKALAPAEPGRRRHVLADGEPHFLVRVTENGTKTFYLNRRPTGSSRPVMLKLCAFKLDRNGRGNLNEARKLSVEATKALDAGLHPKREARKKVKHSFGELAEAYIQRLHASGLRHVRDVEGALRREFLGQNARRARLGFGKREWRSEWYNTADPAWRSRELHRIDRHAVRDRLQAIAQRNVFAARHAHSALRRVFRWALDQGMVDHSPVADLRAQSFGVTKRQLRRRRTLTNHELRAVWQAAGTMGVYGVMVRVLMLTGQRLSEWAKARRSELIEDGGLHLLVIGGERYKNEDAHEVPLTPRVRELLGTLPVHAGSDWLFSITGNRPINGLSRMKAQLDRASGISGYVLHDLRRTCRTGLGTLRVPRDVAERVIGHTLGELDEVYDRGSHRHAKHEALLAWESRLLEIVGETTPPRGLRLVGRAAAA